MKAFVMAAGLGTRLFPLTETLPKSMLPVANTPIIGYILDLLKTHGINDLIVNLHSIPHKISSYLNNAHDFNITYSVEDSLLGTAGGLKNVQKLIEGKTFMVVSSDILTDINLTNLINFHKHKKALATIGLIKADDVSNYGVAVTDSDNRIISFQEKPSQSEAPSNLVNVGVYIFEPEIFDYIPSNTVYDFGRQVFPKLVELDKPLFGYTFEDNYWRDIGSFNNYLLSNLDMISNKVKLNKDCDHLSNGPEEFIHSDISHNSVIGYKCTLADNSSVNNSVILDNCIIGSSVIIENCIIGEGCKIPSNSVIKNCVITKNFSPIPME